MVSKMESCLIFIWIIFISNIHSSVPSTIPSTSAVPSTTLSTSAVYKHLMLLSAGSGQYFNQTWQLYSYNDPHGNKSDGSVEDLILGGEFKAYINPVWGEAQWILIDYLSSLGNILGQMQFYVPGYNITAQTTWMMSAFDQILPLAITWSDASVFDRTGDREVLVGNTTANNVWMSILHTTTGYNPEFVIVSNASEPFTTGSMGSFDSMGCKPVTTVTLFHKITDGLDMTIDKCYLLCSGTSYLYVGLKSGTECYCVDIIIANLYDDLPQYCTYKCSGNSAQICGGSSTAYVSVYNVTTLSDNLDSLVESNSTTLLTKTYVGYRNEISIDVASQTSWFEDYIFVNGIKVTGENSTGHAVKFHIEHKYNYGDTHQVYKTSINGTTWIGLTGIIYELEPLLLRELRVVFKQSTTNILVDMIGPTGTPSNPGYLRADYLLVSALYAPVTTNTSTTTVPTTTVSNITSTATLPNTLSTTLTNTSFPTTTPILISPTIASTTNSSTTTIIPSTNSTNTSGSSTSNTPQTSPLTPTTSTTSNNTTSTLATTTTTNTSVTSSPLTSTTSGSLVSPTSPPATTTLTTSTSAMLTITSITTNSPTFTTIVPTTNSPSTTVTTTTATTTSTLPPTTTSSSSTSTLSTTTMSPTLTTAALSTTSVSATTVVYSNYSILVNGVVYCPCSMFVTQNTTNSTIDIDIIIAELTLDKDSLSSNTRKYNSADDTRPSARTLGALGVIIITAVVASIVAMDSATLISEAKKIKKNYRYLKKQLSRRSLKVDDISSINNTESKSESLPEVLS